MNLCSNHNVNVSTRHPSSILVGFEHNTEENGRKEADGDREKKTNLRCPHLKFSSEALISFAPPSCTTDERCISAFYIVFPPLFSVLGIFAPTFWVLWLYTIPVYHENMACPPRGFSVFTFISSYRTNTSIRAIRATRGGRGRRRRGPRENHKVTPLAR